jgi:integrase
MAITTNQIIPTTVKRLPPGFHSDGGNLYLRVKKTGARSWVFRYKVAGKVTELGLGSINSCSLKQARDLASKMRNAINDGSDPALIIKPKLDFQAKSFKEYALELIDAKRPEWRNSKHAQQWENTLSDYVYPKIGKKLPKDITLDNIKSILTPIWHSKTETATRVRGRIESILDYAFVHEEIDRRNPARWKGNLDKILASPKKIMKVKHHPAAHYEEIYKLMDVLRKKKSISALNLRFTILTATRSSESRGALWPEIDLKNNLWTIPPERMKGNREHKIPLCDEAIEIINAVKSIALDKSNLVFSTTERNAIISDTAVTKTLHAILPDASVHGFRSTFRVWGAEKTSTPSAALELALAHVNKNEVEAAYQRSDLLDIRRKLMKAWGDYCNEPPSKFIGN